MEAPPASFRAGRGEPLVLLHPFAASWHVWNAVVPHLADEFDLFAPTLRGHWGGPPVRRLHLSVEQFADDIERELDTLGWATAHVAGNSLGGLVALELGRRGRARTVTAFAPAGGWHPYSRAAWRMLAFFMSRYPLRHIVKPLQPALRHPRVRRFALADAFRHGDRVSLEDVELFTTAMANCMLFHPVALLRAFSFSAQGLDEIRCPVRILHCEHDRIAPEIPYGARWNEIPGVDIQVLRGVGHVPMPEAPALIAETIRAHIAA
ncbi:MAG TPA: alpha/beta hydrolase [Kofleriaceae bacterium]